MKTIFLVFLLLAGTAVQALQIGPVAGYKVTKKDLVSFGEYRTHVSCQKPSCKLRPHMVDRNFYVEGQIETLSVFAAGAARVSPLQVAREYTSGLQKAGAELMNPESGENGAFVFKLREGKADTWVVLNDNFDGYYTLVVIKPQARESTVLVQASELTAALQAEGMATVYLEFDSGRAELKPAGAATVEEIAKALRQDPALKLSVEGHTDNVGDAAANKQLSLARAQAVLAALRTMGIDMKRLAAKGFGPEFPISDNRKEEGRAKNRRVELVRVP